MADYSDAYSHSSTISQECGCETTYKGAVPVTEKVCRMHRRYVTTCGECWAMVLPEHREDHVGWHARTVRR